MSTSSKPVRTRHEILKQELNITQQQIEAWAKRGLSTIEMSWLKQAMDQARTLHT